MNEQEFECVVCGEVDFGLPEWGYCDNTLDCASAFEFRNVATGEVVNTCPF